MGLEQTRKLLSFCSVCEKEIAGKLTVLDNSLYFICKNNHKTRIGKNNENKNKR